MIKPEDYQIPSIIADVYQFPIKIKSFYLVSQIGCPYNCDFCITSTLQYTPFSNSKKIIECLEAINKSIGQDFFIQICEPNACFPERVWNEVFEYFMNEGKTKNRMYIICLISLAHLAKFNLKKIQSESSLKFFFVNYGIESTLTDNYVKNKGISNKFIQYLSTLGIITNHNFILGLPFHNKKNIEIEIKRNLEYDSCWYFISNMKPLPMTEVYNLFNNQGRIFNDDLPPEMVYREGFFAFDHPTLGKGYSALKYAFKAYIESEKKVSNTYSAFANALQNSPILEQEPSILKVIESLRELSEMNNIMIKPRVDINVKGL